MQSLRRRSASAQAIGVALLMASSSALPGLAAVPLAALPLGTAPLAAQPRHRQLSAAPSILLAKKADDDDKKK